MTTAGLREGVEIVKIVQMPVKTISKKKKGKKENQSMSAWSEKATPTRALSAFMHWGQEMRPKLKLLNPSAGFGELGKLLGVAWAELSDEEKIPYQQMAALDRARYDKEMESVPKAPKKNLSAFIIYSADRRPTVREMYPEKTMSEIGKLLGLEWREVDSEVRERYTSRAEVDKARYEREWSKFSAEYPDLAEEMENH